MPQTTTKTTSPSKTEPGSSIEPVYPQPAEILNNLYVPNKEELKILTEWKSNYFFPAHSTGSTWKQATVYERHNRIRRLLQNLRYSRKSLAEAEIADDTEFSYQPAGDGYYMARIFLDEKHPSIISSLHEYGHHLYGEDELDACQYSIGMFKAVFPEAFAKLQWEGHKLVQPSK